MSARGANVSLVVWVSLCLAGSAAAQGTRASFGLQVLYGFEERAGDTIRDLSGVGDAFDLVIDDTTAVAWLPSGGLAFLGSGSAVSTGPAEKVFDALNAGDAVTVELWLSVSDTAAPGPSGILALAVDSITGASNFRLQQDLASWALRLRTTATDSMGELGQELAVEAVAGLTHLVYTRNDAGEVTLFLDGVAAVTDILPGTLANWDPAARLILGGSSWSGETHLVAVYNRALAESQVAQNFAAGPRLSAVGPMTRHVASSGSDLTGDGSPENPYATIQRAVDLSIDGDAVVLADGTFKGPGNRAIDLRGLDLVIASGSGDRSACVVDAGGEIGFWLHSEATASCELRSLTIKRASVGVLIGDPAADSGASPTLVDCVVDSCATGIEVRDTSSAPLISGCLISRNGVGLSYLEGAAGGRVEGTRITGSVGSGLLTSGTETVYGTLGFTVADCIIDGNSGDGIRHLALFGQVRINESDIHDNGAWGVYSNAYQDFGVAINGGAVFRNGTGGINTLGSEFDYITDCEIYENQGPGLLTDWDMLYSISGCIVRDNTGDGIAFSTVAKAQRLLFPIDQRVTISGCQVYRNGGDGINFSSNNYLHHDSLIIDCTIWDNVGAGIRVATPYESSYQNRIFVERSTLVGNAVGILLESPIPFFLKNTLVAFNLGEGLACTAGAAATVETSNLYGNLGGDEPACLPGLFGIDNNMSVDPRFCDTANHVFTLYNTSPCLPANNVAGEQIGAHGRGCTEAPVIVSVADVGNDQGRQVRLIWARSEHDRPGSAHVITGYGIYRQQGDFKSGSRPMRDGNKIIGWDYLAIAPARQDEIYQMLAVTLCDSTINSGQCESTFMVSAVTANPGVYFDSEPMTGYSVDNLCPALPANLAVAYAAERNVLTWVPPTDADFSHVLIFRTLSEMPAPTGTEVPVSQTSQTSWTDTIAVGSRGWDYSYYLAAVDLSGNIGAIINHDSATAVNELGLPRRTELHANAPNPFNPRTRIAFDLAAAGPVELTVYDVAGRMIRRLLNGDMQQSGRHAVDWWGQDGSNRTVGAGVYVYRLVADGVVQTRTMMLIK